MTLRGLWQASSSVSVMLCLSDFMVWVKLLFVHNDLKENLVQILSDEW